MKSIKEKSVSEINIEKSRFITILSPVHSKEDIIKVLNETKLEYPNATHYCYAYIIDTDQKCSDDKEPSGTAGMPMLNVLKNQNLDHIIGIVVRYFGGIKLGAGGLVRAYTKAMTTGLEQMISCELVSGYLITCRFVYDHSKMVDHLLKDERIINKYYDNEVTYEIEIPNEMEQKIHDMLLPYIKDYQRIKEIYIEKKNA